MHDALPTIQVALDDAGETALAREAVRRVFRNRVQLTTAERVPARVRIVSENSLPTRPRKGETVVLIGDIELPATVTLMRSRRWLDHVVSPRSLEGGAFAGALWRLLSGQSLGAAPVFGKEFRGRKVTIRDSGKRAPRIETITGYARDSGASGTVAEKIRDLAEELITNAIYDAPAEQSGRAVPRTERVVVPASEGVTVTYGMARQTFFLRVRDQHGALRRKRLFDVLARCAESNGVALDTSRGGAGLGMWRSFSAASQLVVQVQARESTEFLVGVDLTRGKKAARGRAIHLFFENTDPDSDETTA
jgi:hypothetical protein